MSDGVQQRRLDELLAGRKDWRQESDDPSVGMIWCFGIGGESRLVVSIIAGRFVLYSANSDDDVELTNIEEVRRWLDLLEPSHAGLSETGKRLGGALLAAEAEEWLDQP